MTSELLAFLRKQNVLNLLWTNTGNGQHTETEAKLTPCTNMHAHERVKAVMEVGGRSYLFVPPLLRFILDLQADSIAAASAATVRPDPR